MQHVSKGGSGQFLLVVIVVRLHFPLTLPAHGTEPLHQDGGGRRLNGWTGVREKISIAGGFGFHFWGWLSSGGGESAEVEEGRVDSESESHSLPDSNSVRARFFFSCRLSSAVSFLRRFLSASSLNSEWKTSKRKKKGETKFRCLWRPEPKLPSSWNRACYLLTCASTLSSLLMKLSTAEMSFWCAIFRFCSRDLVSWQRTATPVGVCLSRTALEDLLTLCPPGPSPRATLSVMSPESSLGTFRKSILDLKLGRILMCNSLLNITRSIVRPGSAFRARRFLFFGVALLFGGQGIDCGGTLSGWLVRRTACPKTPNFVRISRGHGINQISSSVTLFHKKILYERIYLSHARHARFQFTTSSALWHPEDRTLSTIQKRKTKTTQTRKLLRRPQVACSVKAAYLLKTLTNPIKRGTKLGCQPLAPFQIWRPHNQFYKIILSFHDFVQIWLKLFYLALTKTFSI